MQLVKDYPPRLMRAFSCDHGSDSEPPSRGLPCSNSINIEELIRVKEEVPDAVGAAQLVAGHWDGLGSCGSCHLGIAGCLCTLEGLPSSLALVYRVAGMQVTSCTEQRVPVALRGALQRAGECIVLCILQSMILLCHM